MANPNTPFGFRPIIRAGGSPFSINEYGKPATEPNAIFAFDLVIKAATATPLPELPLAYNLPGIQSGYQGTPGTSLWLGSSFSYGAASTASVHPITDEPDVLFIAQSSPGAVTTAAAAGKNANVLLTTPGNLLTKMSAMQVNTAGIAIGAALDLRIQRIAMIGPNVEGVNAILEVSINKHALGLQTAGV